MLSAAWALAGGALGASPLPLGVFLGNGANGAARLPAFEQWLGREPAQVLDFFAYDSWASLQSDAAWTCASWRGPGLRPLVRQVCLSVPLTIQGATLAEVADGRRDAVFLAVGRSMVASGWGGAIVRLGWEFNGSWMPWAAASDPKAYVAAYRRVVQDLRSTQGAHFTFDWCCAWGRNQIAPDTVYPGDDVVDIVGMDLYTRSYNPFTRDPGRRWRLMESASYGLDWLVAFSRARHKQLSIPEWGTGEALTPDGGVGGGDDALFVENMANFLESSGAAYSDYWDFHAPDYDASVSDGQHPLTGAALRERFGPAAYRSSGPQAAPGTPSLP